MDEVTKGYGVFVLESQWPDDFGNLYIPFDGKRYVWPDGLIEKRRYWFRQD